jgi:hypothetical protein
MDIKKIFDEISSCSGDIAKKKILEKYNENKTLKDVLYLACSKRVKFYLKQILEYTPDEDGENLQWALDGLKPIISREYTGGQAQKWLSTVMSSISADDAYIIERIIDKDPKIGMGTTYINEVFPKLIEDTPYQGAIAFNEKKARKLFENDNKAFSQIKMDGRYCNAIIFDGEVTTESRAGEVNLFTGAEFIKELSKLDNCVLNGELTMVNFPRTTSNGIIASITDILTKKSVRTDKENKSKLDAFYKKHGDFELALNAIRYTVWDIITIDEYNKASSDKPYHKRLAELTNYLTVENNFSSVSIIDNKIVDSFEQAMEHFKELLGKGEEGTVLKSNNGAWKDGKPSWQIKLKLELNLDLVIVGFNYGTKGSKNEFVISSLNAESSCGLLKTSPQGLNEKLMKEITANQDELLGTIIEIKCSGLSTDSSGAYSVLYPAFKHFRDDKKVGNSLVECINIQNASLGLTN